MGKVFKEAKGETSKFAYTLRLVKSDRTGGFLIRIGYMEKASGSKGLKVVELWNGDVPLTNATEAKKRFDIEAGHMGAN